MICPRCDKDKGIKCFEAPKDRSWELYRCRYCDFIWRSTEKEHIKNHRLYSPDFKLNEDRVGKMIERPTIPPLRRDQQPRILKNIDRLKKETCS
jgi:hypothetical protein